MKALAYIYILTTWVFVPIANYQPEERTESRTESQPEILFWCDCGAKYVMQILDVLNDENKIAA